MLNTIMFDLDGTLLPMTQKNFLEAYFREIAVKFAALGLDAEKSVPAVWAGTKAMLKNDGTVCNADRFWAEFSSFCGGLEDRLADIEAETDLFYSDEFNRVRDVIEPTEVPRRLVCSLRDKGYTAVLATNPLFPAQAVASRLGWIGLAPEDFVLLTNYKNSRFCKPNLNYFRDIFSVLNTAPEQCMMVGNTVSEDMCAALLGCSTYLVTDYLENPDGLDFSIYQQGSLADFEAWAESLPRIGQDI